MAYTVRRTGSHWSLGMDIYIYIYIYIYKYMSMGVFWYDEYIPSYRNIDIEICIFKFFFDYLLVVSSISITVRYYNIGI